MRSATLEAGFTGGANPTGARAYNDRLILSLIRSDGPLSKAELSRRTGLSPQTLGMIVRRLCDEALLIAEAPVRGRQGQPSTPFRLNPDAVFAFGLKIGRRSATLTLCDFGGAVRGRAEEHYRYPTPEAVAAFARREATRLLSPLSATLRDRLIGTGIAMPFGLWDWEEALGAPPGALLPWRDVDVAEMVADALGGGSASLSNDATAACAAELTALRGPPHDFCTVFVGWFVGGGTVLDGRLHVGRTGNAGALGSMLVQGPDGPVPLLQPASLMTLERAVGSPLPPVDATDDYWRTEPAERWITGAAAAIAQAAVNVSSVIDFGVLRVDGAFPTAVRARLVAAIREAHARLDRRGLSPLAIEEGRAGPDARSIGAAMLPILAEYSRDSDVLIKRRSTSRF